MIAGPGGTDGAATAFARLLAEYHEHDVLINCCCQIENHSTAKNPYRDVRVRISGLGAFVSACWSETDGGRKPRKVPTSYARKFQAPSSYTICL